MIFLEAIMIFLFAILLGYVIYNLASMIAMKNADVDEESEEKENDN